MEKHYLENTDITLGTHDTDDCWGEFCTIHKRSDHHMRSFPQHFNFDRFIMERICSHDIGHPDPDEVLLQIGQDDGVHGCDGCCLAPDESSL